jgi:hypothetical protein
MAHRIQAEPEIGKMLRQLSTHHDHTPASDFDKISPTALLVAYARQFSDIPYTKEVAELTDAAATVKQFVSEGQEQPIVVAALVEARYKTIELQSTI